MIISNDYVKQQIIKVNFLLGSFLILLFTSCEVITGGGGQILDEKGYPVPNTKVELMIDGKTDGYILSKEDGKFSIGRIMGCAFKCPESTLVFSKNGYKTIQCEIDKELSKNPDFDFENIRVILQVEK